MVTNLMTFTSFKKLDTFFECLLTTDQSMKRLKIELNLIANCLLLSIFNQIIHSKFLIRVDSKVRRTLTNPVAKPKFTFLPSLSKNLS